MKTKVTMRQIGGDDGCHWCVFVDGYIKWNGMTRSEATWRRDQERLDEMERNYPVASKGEEE